MDQKQYDQYVILTKWGVKWLKFACNYVVHGGPANRFAKDIIKQFDDVSNDPLEYVEEHTTEYKKMVINVKSEQPISVQKVEKKKKVLVRGNRSKFSASIAKLAYNKFGQRPMSEANVLVTRKWIQKYLEEPAFKDLRTCDKNLAIDRALFLSFLPTKDFQMMKLATTTTEWEKRNRAESVFGRIFRLAGMGEVDPPSYLAF
jgi:hypothetical protein